MQFGGTGLRVGGLSWVEGERESRISELTTRMLCARHNSMLHTLDDAATALHDAWLTVAERNETYLGLSGDLLERWAVKVLVGMIVSGAARVDGIAVRTQPPQAVLDVLFGLRDLSSPRGFYFVIHEEHDGGLKIKVNTAPRGHELEGIAFGITIQFLAFRFMTWLHRLPPEHKSLIYRPAGFDFAGLGRIDLEWSKGAANPAVPLDLKVKARPEESTGAE